MQPATRGTSGWSGRAAGGAAIALVAASALALGCQELVDSDVWWHVRAGRWIVENGRVPGEDPFTFGSPGRVWVDLHWLFQLALAGAYAAGGATGMILLAAGLCASVVLTGIAARARCWPVWVVAACWLPGLVLLSARAAPRPELVSLLAMAGSLAILTRADEAGRPGWRWLWLWLLPVVQVVWVNAHGLFVLGPVLFGLYIGSRFVEGGRRPSTPGERKHLAGVAAAVVAACLVNPYGWRGAILPLELFPKITAWGDVYKSYIIELMGLREFVARQTPPIAAGNLYNRVECFLLWVLPLSWIIPSAWRASAASGASAGISGQDPRWPRPAWAAAMLAPALVLFGVLGLPAQGAPGSLILVGRMAPAALAALAVGIAWMLRRSWRAAAIAGCGFLAVAAWMVWLRAYLFGAEGGPGPSAWLDAAGRGSAPLAGAAALLGAFASGLAVGRGARPFRIALAVAFGYLAIQAIRNANLFAVAAAHVLAANLGEWAAELSDARPDPGSDRRRHALNGLVAVAAGFLAIATGSGWVFRATGERRSFGLGASPLAYAHDAARFAARPGLPDRALVYSLRQAGVYEFHDGPARKVYLDGRLEVPDRDTFASYVWFERALEQDARGWRDALRQIGEPLILLDHDGHSGAEATLMADPGWRCLWFDPIASVFVSTSRRDLGAAYPSVDFAARYFRDPLWRRPLRPILAMAEGRAMLGVATALRGRSASTREQRAGLLLAACHRLGVVPTDPDPPDAAALSRLGEALEALALEVSPGQPSGASWPPGPDEPWDPARSLLIAQATAVDRRALEIDPGEIRALFALHRSFGARGMPEPREEIAAMMRRAWAAAVGRDAETGTPPDSTAMPRNDGARPESASASASAWDHAATELLHAGRPAEARSAVKSSAGIPSMARQLARTAAASHVARDFAVARDEYRAAVEKDPDLAEAWFGLALLHVQLGEAEEALAACLAARKCQLTPAQSAALRVFERLLGRPGRDGDGSKPNGLPGTRPIGFDHIVR